MKINFIIITTLVLSHFINLSLCFDITSPSLRFSVSQAGVDSLESEFFPVFLTGEKIKLDDIIIKQHLDFLGTIRLNITDSQFLIDGFKGENVKILFNERNTVQIYFNNLTGNINFNYSFKSGFYENNSPGFVNVSNISIEIQTDLLSQPNFYEPTKLSPKVNITNFQSDIGGVDVNFKNLGNLEKIIKYLIDNVQEAFIKLIKEKLSLSSGNINKLINEKLAKIKLEDEVPQTNLTIGYTLSSDPQVLNKNLEFSLNTTIIDKNTNETYSGQPYPIPHAMSNSSELLTTYINENVVESGLFILYKENKTNYFINSQNISTLTTLTLGFVIPELYEHYKDTKKVDINLNAEKMPQISFQENLTLIELDYLTDFIVHVNDTLNPPQVETAFKADLKMNINFTILMHGGVLKAKLNEIKINKFNVTNSNIGPIDDKNLPDKLNGFLNGFLQVISNKIDEVLGKFKIPEFRGISFNQTEMMIHPGYLEVSTTPHVNKNQNNTLNLLSIDEIKFLIERVSDYKGKNRNLRLLN
jgi:hypothetical protein